MPSRQTNLFGIQYLRGLCAVFVVIFHISRYIPALARSDALVGLSSGVDMFFVISGFVMVYSTDCGRNTKVAPFFMKRLLRIVPLYWAVTIVMIGAMIVVPQFVRSSKLYWSHAAASLMFVAQVSPKTPGVYYPVVIPGWTLNLEMLFYSFFTIGLAIGRSGLWLIVVTIIPILVLSIVGITMRPAGVLGFYTNPIMLEFGYGMILGLAFDRMRVTIGQPATIAIMVGALLILVISPAQYTTPRWFRMGVPALIVVACSLYIRFPRHQAMESIGAASYAIYLTHFFIVSAIAQGLDHLATGPTNRMILFYAGGCPLVVIVGLLCHRYVETPLNDWARRLIRVRPSRSPMILPG